MSLINWNANPQLVIWGASGGYRYFRERFPYCNIQFLLDGNQTLWSTRVDGFEVRPPKAAAACPASGSLVVVCSYAIDPIGRQLEDFGLHRNRDYFWANDLLQSGEDQFDANYFRFLREKLGLEPGP